MAQITFSDESEAGDIPTFEITKEEILDDYFTKVDDLLEYRNGKVIVCFQSWTNGEFQDAVQSIYITQNEEDATEYFFKYIELMECKEIDFNFFCFNTFEEAFNYCLNLKEGL
jgi:hypothetical protein